MVPNPVLLGGQLVHALADRRELVVGRQPVRRNVLYFTGDLRLQAGDPDHEKFVQVLGVNRQKFQPLVERDFFVVGFVQDPGIEFEPRQLAIDEQRGVVQAGG